MSKRQASPAPAARHARSPLQLHIAGSGLLLNGRFAQWVPLLMDGVQDAAGDAHVQLLVDATSAPLPSGPDAPLFSFHSRRVRALAPMLFAVEGTFRAEGGEHLVSATVQAPDPFTPFFLITFALPRAELPGVWATFDRSVGHGGDPEGNVRARAWLRPPAIAAA